MRFAQRPSECDALRERLEAARKSLAPDRQAVFDACVDDLNASHVVMNRSIGDLADWLQDKLLLHYCYHAQVRLGRRVPSDNVYDLQRKSAENTVNPFFFEDLSIAALSLDGKGMPYYGPYTVRLKEKALAHRATVFTENPFIFTKRHNVTAGELPPPGHRAPWQERASVAMAKIGAKLAEAFTPPLPRLLMSNDRDSSECDFVEVHIFGSLHASSIESVAGPAPSIPEDAVLWSSAKRKLAQLGARVEETPCAL
ncbi:MAG TPA: hypothetical protein VG943_05015 [Caulobacterales bacterium]|nr:hypothetical protein [Caulobacterales bacterium]